MHLLQRGVFVSVEEGSTAPTKEPIKDKSKLRCKRILQDLSGTEPHEVHRSGKDICRTGNVLLTSVSELPKDLGSALDI